MGGFPDDDPRAAGAPPPSRDIGAGGRQLAREAELHGARVALVRPGVASEARCVPAAPGGVEAPAAGASAVPAGRREQRERVRVERVVEHRPRERGAARVRVEAVALAAAVDEAGRRASVEGHGADVALAACGDRVAVGEREGVARVREVVGDLLGAGIAVGVEEEAVGSAAVDLHPQLRGLGAHPALALHLVAADVMEAVVLSLRVGEVA